MIEIKNLKKQFGERVLFEDFNLRIEDKSLAMIFGASGCGKTTLLNMIGGIEPFDGGEILADDIDLSKRKMKRMYLSSRVGFLFQNFALVDDYTVLQNMNMVKKRNRTDISIEEALKRVGMEGTEKKKVYQLSGGEQQRIALARLMVKKCDIVLADEPTGSLDRDNAKRVMEILDGMRDLGKTVIMVTHSDQYMDMATQVIKLSP